MVQNRWRYATILALGTAIISGTANFFNKFAVTAVQGPVLFTTLKNATVAIFLVGLIFAAKQWREIIRLNIRQMVVLLTVGVVGGGLPFALYFTGLTQTSALNAALIHKTLVLWVLLLAIPLLREKTTRFQWFGIAAIFAANLLVGGFSGFRYNAGELMIMLATMLWAVENIIAKIALRDVSALTVATARMVIGSVLLFTVVCWQGEASAMLQLTAVQWGWVLLAGGLLASYVLTWYTALKYAPATYVATLLVPATLVTNVWSAIFITHAISVREVQSALLFTVGALLIVRFARHPQIKIQSDRMTHAV
ncbi:MAG: DMT family transporter [Patescibacteria group bacterium]|nr:DMT family transporter [Patescibacteria group bacterium]